MSDADDTQAAEYRRAVMAREEFWRLRQRRLEASQEAVIESTRDWSPLIPDTGWNPPNARPDQSEEEDSGYVIVN